MSGQPHESSQPSAGKWTFLAVAFIVFGASAMALGAADLLPNGTFGEVADGPRPPAGDTRGDSTLPERIEIPKLSLSATVANPTTTDPKTLDEALLYGAVRYPTSGALGVEGQNMVIFGHSSYLPVVHNQAYKTFDGIQNLAKGDRILVTGDGKVFTYEVETVASASTADGAIPLSVTGAKLTLVTCDSFATKSDRFVVIAHLVGSYPVSS